MAIARQLNALWLPLALALAGCATPSAPPPPSRPAPPAPQALPAAFPAKIQALQSVVITYRAHPFVALGWFNLDQAAHRFTLSAMTPAGLTLFNLTETGGAAEASFAFPVGERPDAWAAAMAQDIRRIFVDTAQQAGDVPVYIGDAWRVTREEQGRRSTELEYRERDTRLVRARWYERGKLVAETTFDDFQLVGRWIMPKHIVHRQRKTGYELDIRFKQVQQVGEGGMFM